MILPRIEPAMRLALGTVQFGQPYGIANVRGRVDEAEVRKILTYARDAGIDMLDTAIAYGDAESTLGRIGVGDFHVISKVPTVAHADIPVDRWLLEQIEQALERLGVECLYGLLLHHPDDLLGSFAPAISAALVEAKLRGWIGKIGVSVYTPDQLSEVMSRISIELVQIPINVFDRRFETSGLLGQLSGQGIEIHGRSAFLQGLLLMSPSSVPPSFRRFSPTFSRWQAWLAAEGVSALQACLAHVASYPEITRCVVGCDGFDQMRDIVEAAQQLGRRAPTELASTDAFLINPALWSKS